MTRLRMNTLTYAASTIALLFALGTAADALSIGGGRGDGRGASSDASAGSSSRGSGIGGGASIGGRDGIGVGVGAGPDGIGVGASIGGAGGINAGASVGGARGVGVGADVGGLGINASIGEKGVGLGVDSASRPTGGAKVGRGAAVTRALTAVEIKALKKDLLSAKVSIRNRARSLLNANASLLSRQPGKASIADVDASTGVLGSPAKASVKVGRAATASPAPTSSLANASINAGDLGEFDADVGLGNGPDADVDANIGGIGASASVGSGDGSTRGGGGGGMSSGSASNSNTGNNAGTRPHGSMAEFRATLSDYQLKLLKKACGNDLHC